MATPTKDPSGAPLCVPVELCRDGDRPSGGGDRWFRLAVAISPTELRLRLPLPPELREGPVALRLHLPPLPLPAPEPAPAALSLRARAADPADEEEEAAGSRRLIFSALSEAEEQPLWRYVRQRTGTP